MVVISHTKGYRPKFEMDPALQALIGVTLNKVVPTPRPVLELRDLCPQFIQLIDVNKLNRTKYVSTAREADGLRMLCPHCYQQNDGPSGTHSVLIWRPCISVDVIAGCRQGSIWACSGNYDNLTLGNYVEIPGCHWRGRILEGRVICD